MSGEKSGGKFLIAIAVAFLVPLSCFLVVSRLSKKKQKQMPHFYVADQINGNDTIFHRVADLVLTNQFGQQVSLNKGLIGKIIVIEFIYTTCPDICPRLMGNMKNLQNSFKKDPKKEGGLDSVVQLITITINPEHDSFQALRIYADRLGVNHDNWWFLTGDKKTIYNFARNELHLQVGPGDGGAEDFIHPQVMTLLDKDRNIRGYYNGLSDTEANKCTEDIVLLTMERKHKK